jgi:hypothetical protein
MFPSYDSVLGCFCLTSNKLPSSYLTQSKTVLVDLGDLGLRGWQRLRGLLVFRVVRVVDLDQVLLITQSWLPELFLLCCKLFLLLHRHAPSFHTT